MHLIDHIFILVLFVVQPIYGALDSRRYIARIDAGRPADRVRFYVETAIVEWVFLAALVIAWFTLGRPAADLGFVTLDGVRLWGGAGVALL